MPNPFDAFAFNGYQARNTLKGLGRVGATLAELSEIDSSDFPQYSTPSYGGIPDFSRGKYTPASGNLGNKLKRAFYEFTDMGYKNRAADREAYYRLKQSGGQRGFAGYGNSYGRALPSAVKSGRSGFSRAQSTSLNLMSLGAGTTGGNQQCRSVASNVPGM